MFLTLTKDSRNPLDSWSNGLRQLVSFSPDGQLLASGSYDGTIRVGGGAVAALVGADGLSADLETD